MGNTRTIISMQIGADDISVKSMAVLYQYPE